MKLQRIIIDSFARLSDRPDSFWRQRPMLSLACCFSTDVICKNLCVRSVFKSRWADVKWVDVTGF